MDKEALNYLAAAATATIVGAEHGMPSDALVVQKEARVVSLEEFKAQPDSIKAKPKLQSAASFIAYTKKFIDADTSVYLDLASDTPAFTAILDHHGRNHPAWGRHAAVFAPEQSLEWIAWKALHGMGAFNQRQLIAFIEDHFTDIVDPGCALVLAAVQRFELVEKHTYDSQQNLDNGSVALTFVKAAQPMTVQFPHRLTILVPVFENEAPMKHEVRLRFEASEGGLKFKAQFVQDPERTQRNALRAISDKIRTELSSATIYEGTR